MMSMKAQPLPFDFDFWCISQHETVQGSQL
jgi:hypothetical protein